MVTLGIGVCDARIYYEVDFYSASQALAFIERKSAEDKANGYPYGNHAVEELYDYPLAPFGPLSEDTLALYDYLYPTCEHGLSAALCSGPMHYSDSF
jgi:hypothetical protein